MDLWLARADGLEFAVMLEDLSQTLENKCLSIFQFENALVGGLKVEMPDLQLTNSEDVEVGGRRSRLLRLQYTLKKKVVTEFRVLVLNSGFLYHLRALSMNPNADSVQLEAVLAGFEFPADAVE